MVWKSFKIVPRRCLGVDEVILLLIVSYCCCYFCSYSTNEFEVRKLWWLIVAQSKKGVGMQATAMDVKGREKALLNQILN